MISAEPCVLLSHTALGDDMFCAPYRDALFAIFQIDDERITMQGRKTGFVGPSPQMLGFPQEKSYFTPAPVVRNRCLPLRALQGDGRTELIECL